jgi:hypothetical protein
MSSKPFWYSKTFYVNAGSFVLVVLGMLEDFPDTAHYAPYFILLVNILNVGLRFLTDQPVTLTRAPRPPKPRRKREPHEIVPDVESVLPPAEVAKIDRDMEHDKL